MLYNRAPTESSQYRNLKGGSAVGQPKKGCGRVDESVGMSSQMLTAHELPSNNACCYQNKASGVDEALGSELFIT